MAATTSTPAQALRQNSGVAISLLEQGRRDVVCTYVSHAEAQRAIERLAIAGINASTAAIEAECFEHMPYPSLDNHFRKALLIGAVGGAVVGLLLSSLLGMLSFVTPSTVFIELGIYGLMIGAIIGLILGGIFYTLVNGEYDRYWSAGLPSRQYNLLIEHDLIGEAQHILFHTPLEASAINVNER